MNGTQTVIFDVAIPLKGGQGKKTKEELKRLDLEGELREKVLSYCRLQYGSIWKDPISGHRVGVLDATVENDVNRIMNGQKAVMTVNDPPYNVAVGNANTKNLFKTKLDKYVEFSRRWIENTISSLKNDAHFYLWMGTDYKDSFQPLPDIMILLRKFDELRPRNFITMRNQRGFGTQKNWMWVRQELL